MVDYKIDLNKINHKYLNYLIAIKIIDQLHVAIIRRIIWLVNVNTLSRPTVVLLKRIFISNGSLPICNHQMVLNAIVIIKWFSTHL